MRWHIIRTLIHKEALRHLGNRGGIALAALLVVLALLMFASGKSETLQSGGGLIRSVHHCYIDYWQDDPLVEFLKERTPTHMQGQIRFRDVRKCEREFPDGTIQYGTGTGGIQLRPPAYPGGPAKIWCWYPGEDRSVMAPFEAWFWRAVRSYHRERLKAVIEKLPADQRTGVELPPMERDETWVWRESHQQFRDDVAALKARLPAETAAQMDVPEYTFERSPVDAKPVGTRTTIASALVMFAMFFVCVYLLPSLTCEERERGVLLAQALSPASPLEIVAAKLLFYPVVGVAFAGLLGGLTTPAVLGRWMFWASVFVLALGSLGIGMTIACLNRSQRSASMAALCYLLVISTALLICQSKSIPYLPHLALEYHGPRLLTAVMTNAVEKVHYYELAGAFGIAAGWNVIATVVFRKYGWQ
jgi:ABC-type multidrug transport system permease subunit